MALSALPNGSLERAPFLTFWQPKRLHPWSQNGTTSQGGAVLDLFLDKNSSTFEGGTKIVPGVELSDVPCNGSRGGAVLALLFSQCRPKTSCMLLTGTMV